MNQHLDSESKRTFESLIGELKKYYKNSREQDIITIPEIFEVQYREAFVSLWLAYLLDPDRNGLGLEPLKALLRCIGEELIGGEEQVTVEKEVTFSENNRRIDLLISTPNQLIGIENKLYSLEQENQTRDYWNSLQRAVDKDKEPKRKCLGIYLKPEANTSTPCKEFKTVTYSRLIEYLRAIPPKENGDKRKVFILNEFLLYGEKILMNKNKTGYPQMSEDEKLYQENKDILKRMADNHNNHVKAVGVWLKNLFEEMGEGFGLIASKPSTEWWKFIESNQWEKIDFHYELCWGKSDILDLKKSDKVQLCVHLETKDSAARDFIADKNSSYRSKDVLHQETIHVGFSNETDARESIKKIINRLQTEEFQRYARKANGFLSKALNKQNESIY